MGAAVLYEWPAAARFGRVVPKSKFYAHASVTPAVKRRFVDEVQRITWAFKLAEETIRLRATTATAEIQVFVIDAKGDDVSDLVLTAIDKAVKTPIIFEIHRGPAAVEEVRMVAASKSTDAPRPRVGPYLSAPWIAASVARIPLPPAVDLAGLHLQLVSPLLPVALRAGESLSDASERLEQVRRLERQVASLEMRMASEPQFNRKVEFRRELRATRDRLARLGAK